MGSEIDESIDSVLNELEMLTIEAPIEALDGPGTVLQLALWIKGGSGIIEACDTSGGKYRKWSFSCHGETIVNTVKEILAAGLLCIPDYNDSELCSYSVLIRCRGKKDLIRKLHYTAGSDVESTVVDLLESIIYCPRWKLRIRALFWRKLV